MKNTKKSILLFAGILIMLLIINSFFISGITGRIGNARAVIHTNVGWFDKTIDRTVKVINDNNVSLNITVRADSNSSLIKIIDEEFILNPGEEKDAKFMIILKEPGNYEERVNVFFKPEQGNGVALSSNLIIIAEKKDFFLFSFFKSIANFLHLN